MKHLLTMAAALGLATLGVSAELIKNGDFSSQVRHWGLMRTPSYGYTNNAEVKDGELHFSKLTGNTPHYFWVGQPVDIDEGKTYRISFEVKGTEGQKYGVILGAPSRRIVNGKRLTIEGDDWKKVEVPLLSKTGSDTSWVRDTKKIYAKHTLDNGRSIYPGKKKPARPDRPDGDKYATLMMFNIGAVTGEIAFRNVSMVEEE